MIHDAPRANWRPSLPPDKNNPASLAEISSRVDALSKAAQYGWGHTIDIGPYRKEGLLADEYLRIAGALDAWSWWPQDLSGAVVADVGCFTGGLSLYMASRGASVIHAVDEVPEHLDQCAYLASLFEFPAIKPELCSIYRLGERIPDASLDLALVGGVLYHLSDMLVGLHILQKLLKPGAPLILESNAVNDLEHSYANFGRFYAGMWWQPTGLCIEDMCKFMGFEQVEVRFYEQQRCLVKAVASGRDIPFKRGMNWPFESVHDLQQRGMDPTVMAPANIP